MDSDSRAEARLNRVIGWTRCLGGGPVEAFVAALQPLIVH